MATRKKPRSLGFSLVVIHESSYDALSAKLREALTSEIDAEGHHTTYEMGPMAGDYLLDLTIRRGVSARTAAALLRKLADRLERHGGALLSMPQGGEGFFNDRGEPEADPLPLPRDENGDVIATDVE
jgi:hypothetical protein